MQDSRRLPAFLSAVFFFIAVLLPYSASAERSRVIRIGISEYPQYAYKDKNGMCTGADVEYAYKIAQYANLKIQIILIPDAETYFRSLDNGSVDILFDALWTAERAKKYLYSEHAAGSTPMSLYVRNDDDRFEYENIAQLKNLVFGSEAGSYVTTIFIDWCKQHQIAPKIKEYAGSSEVNAALDAHEIDAGVYGTDSVQGYRTIQQFAPTPYYLIFRKSEYDLKNRIDDAMNKVLAENPLYKEQLLHKYAPVTYEIDAFSKAEKAYIDSRKDVIVAVLRNDAPYYFSNRYGTAGGVLPSYYANISSLTGLHFVFSVFSTQRDAINAVKKGDADILAMYSDGLISAYMAGLRLTSLYTNAVNTVLITKSGTDISEVKKIAVKERSREVIRERTSVELSGELVGYNTAADCFKALQHHDVDAMICGMPSATWLINQTNSAAYNMQTLSMLTFDLCGAVAYDNDILCSILNKAIRTSEYNFNGLVSKNTLPESTWHTFLARIPAGTLSIFIIVLLTLVISLIFTLIALIRRQNEKALVAEEKAETERRETQIAAMEKSTEIRNQFFSNISHDMRTPLNAIIGFSDLAQQRAILPETKDYLRKIQASGKLLMTLIDDTLTISKMNSGKLRLNPLPVDSDDLINSLVMPVRATAELKDITFTLENTARRRIVIADKLNTQKILLNLLSNAVKYTPEGGHVKFIVTDDNDHGDEPGFIFQVIDDGIGISEKFLPHIYEPFVQENRSSLSVSGTGLGLSIVKNLVQMMNGTIDVQSVVDKGTTFTVKLHFKETDEKPMTVEPAETQRNLSGEKILLCEDNEMNSEIACTLLQSKGIIVTIADNGQAGVQRFRESNNGEYSAILMDLRMPVMSGYEAAQEIRSLDRSDAPNVPIIAMTADAFEDDAKKCFEAGMNAHISKPLDPEKMFRVLSMVIAEYRRK